MVQRSAHSVTQYIFIAPNFPLFASTKITIQIVSTRANILLNKIVDSDCSHLLNPRWDTSFHRSIPPVNEFFAEFAGHLINAYTWRLISPSAAAELFIEESRKQSLWPLSSKETNGTAYGIRKRFSSIETFKLPVSADPSRFWRLSRIILYKKTMLWILPTTVQYCCFGAKETSQHYDLQPKMDRITFEPKECRLLYEQ